MLFNEKVSTVCLTRGLTRTLPYIIEIRNVNDQPIYAMQCANIGELVHQLILLDQGNNLPRFEHTRSTEISEAINKH